MDLSWIGKYNVLIALFLIVGFLIWKFIIQPIANEGQPIEPQEDEE
ncbi:MAG: hypothetical protein ACTSQ4_02365 [Candidatus Heimdallarchaeaceae archaeon]